MTTNQVLLGDFFLSPRRPKSFSSAVMKRISHSRCQLISKKTERGTIKTVWRDWSAFKARTVTKNTTSSKMVKRTAKLVQEWFQGKMADKFLNKKMWHPRSPDLNPADFYLWGYLKTVVYSLLPKTLEDLMTNIKREIHKSPFNCL